MCICCQVFLALTVFTVVGSLPTFLSQSKSIALLKAEACRAKRALAKAQLSSPSSATIQAQLGVVWPPQSYTFTPNMVQVWAIFPWSWRLWKILPTCIVLIEKGWVLLIGRIGLCIYHKGSIHLKAIDFVYSTVFFYACSKFGNHLRTDLGPLFNFFGV